MNQENTQPSGALIGAMRESSWTMRSIASIVILTFGGLVTSPAVAAVTQEVQKIQWHKADSGNAAKLSAKLDEAHKLLTRFASQGSQKTLAMADVSDQHSQIHGLISDLNDLDKGAMDDFATTEAHIQAHHLPAEIEQRQQQAVKTYRARMDGLMAELKAADATKDTPTFQQHVANAKAQMDKTQVQPFHEKFDPKHLPFSVAKPTSQKPRLTKKDYLARPVMAPKRVQMAANGSLAGIVTAADLGILPTSPSDPSYLAPTDDVQITPAIQAEAKALNNDPVQIYNWVHNNVEYIPTYGSIQGSDMTLQTLKGNDFDQASLLIALLRAANIPSRYVYGTIQVPIAQVENWVGGVTDPNAALNLLGQGGVPVNAVVQGGQIKYAQMEHVWVEAWVNFIPSRAAKSGAGNTWVPMDASFKQYTYSQGMDLQTATPFDGAAFSNQILSTAQVDPSGNWIQGIDETSIDNSIDSYAAKVSNYIQAHNPNATVSDVLGAKTIAQSSGKTLSAGLPYAVVAIGGRSTQVPISVETQLLLTFYSSPGDEASDSPSYEQSIKLVTVVGKRISLEYQTQTAADQAVIDNAAANNQTSFPAYLVNVIPCIKMDSQTIWQGNAVNMGTPQVLNVTVQYSTINDSRDYNVVAGDLDVLGLDAAVVTSGVWQAHTAAHDLTTGQDPAYVQELLYQLMLGYWGELDTYSELVKRQNRIASYRLPSFGMASTPLSIQYNFGVPQSATYDSRMLDVKENRIAAVGYGNDPHAAKYFVEQEGFISSYLESGICDQMFLRKPGDSVSAATALQIANENGIKIYHLTSTNLSSELAQISINNDAEQDIENAVASGMEAYVPARDLSVDGFNGVGYVLLDPTTGSGAYRISGGRDGNNSSAPANVYPMPELPGNKLIGFVVATLAQGSGTTLVNDGPVAGLRMAANTAVIGQDIQEGADGGLLGLLALAITALSMYHSHAHEIEKEYPRINQVIRHYTTLTRAEAIYLSRVIIGGNGDFGPGVYVVEPPDADITCPLSQAEMNMIYDRYNLTGPQRDAYIELVITRAGYWDRVIQEELNSKNAVETIFRLPFLYFGPNSIAIDYYDM